MRMPVVALIALLSTSLASCTVAESSPAFDAAVRAGTATDTVPWTPLRDARVLGKLEERDIDESSAIIAASGDRNLFWTLNDSGNDERLFALDSTGADRGAVDVRAAKNRDWEALALGPCEAGQCLYIGDVGDNLARHQTVRIWRIAEPMPPGRKDERKSERVTRLDISYPDGPRDVEAMWVDADTVIWLATKRPTKGVNGTLQRSLVYRVPAAAWRRDGDALAELVDSLPVTPTRDERTQVTDAALSNPLGIAGRDSLLAVRTYGLVMIFRVAGRSGRPGALVARCLLAPLGEKQGEALTWLPDGRLLFTSEKRGAPLRAARCG
jgi:hypothetical protein